MANARWKLEGPPPVEHRLWGLDRRQMWPTVAVFAVVVLWSVIMPAIDQSVDSLEIAPDTVLDMGPATFSPAAGWVLAQPPSPVGESKQATIVKESITLDLRGGAWTGTATALLDQVTSRQGEFVVEGRTYAVGTAHGVRGVARKINGPNFVGLVASFAEAGGGMAVTAKGPADASAELGRPLAEMIQSIAFKAQEAAP